LDFYLALESREYSLYVMVEFKLGRRCLPLYVVIDVRLRKEKEKKK